MIALFSLFSRTPSRAQFVKAFDATLRELRPDLVYAYDESGFCFRGAGGAIINLHNLFPDYCKTARAARRSSLKNTIQGLTGSHLPATFSEAKASLLPALRHHSTIDLTRVWAGDLDRSGEARHGFVARPLTKELVVAVAYDTAHAIAQVGASNLESWGVSLDEALDVAFENLRHARPPTFIELTSGLFAANYGDFYDAARLCLPELAWQLPLDGDPVAMVPNRSTFLITGHRNHFGIRAMIAASAKALADRPLSAEMLRLHDREWRPWKPEDDGAAIELANLQQELHAGLCEDQRAGIEKALEKSNRDIFVAQFSRSKRDGERRNTSYCVLPYGVHSWLPQTEWVAVQPSKAPEGQALFVTWDSLNRTAGSLLKPLGMTPERYEITRALTPEQLEILRQETAAPSTVEERP